ncbi:hypothetical protein BKM31_15445 [[Actinomadura] parvosata subsp. kistnae]|uniref:Pyrrolo-quinoline quinone repeat domain-containing protein n=1 Tax=[Actinomadura] parvosata subsp. kistnae TaxID=1909395 RepID=A0A1U9ZXK4_9ACTN|nr:hypothetical protein BKM31_15445 [Nonomuraea sp. ATCC 55076]
MGHGIRRGARRGAILRGAILLAVLLLATCAVAARDGATGPPRVLAAWRAAWSVPTEAGYAVPGHTPAGQAVAVATRQGDVRIHDPRTGALRRVVPAGAARPASVTGLWIAAGTLIVSRGAPGGAEQTLHGHDLATGTALWRRAITITDYRPTLGNTGTYHGPRVLATERGIVVVEEPDEPIAVRALDPRTGAVTARWAPPAGCRLTAAATARSVILLSHCQENDLRLASLNPGTLRQEWSRALLSSSAPQGDGPPIGLRAAADGYVHASVGEDDFFYGPDGRLLSTGSQAVPAQQGSPPTQTGSGPGAPPAQADPASGDSPAQTDPGRWSAPLYAGPLPAPGAHGGIELDGTWPLPAYLVSVDTRTGRLGGLPIDVPARLATLAGTSGDLAFVHSDAGRGGRLTAYRLVHERPGRRTAWPDPCTLLTTPDLASFAPGYRPSPATDGAATCDWIPPADGTPVVSLSVDWVSPSGNGARDLFAAEAAAIRQNGDIDPTTEVPGFLSYTVATPNGFYGAALVNVGPVIARLTSASRAAVRLLAASLRRNLLARYQPGVPAPSPTGGPGWNFPADAAIRTDPVVAGGVVHAISGDGVVLALDAATGALRWRFRTGGSVPDAFAVADGSVYAAGNGTGSLVVLDAATGRPRWTRTLTVAGGFVAEGGRLHAWTRPSPASGSATLVTLDPATGATLWTFRPDGDVFNLDPVLSGDPLLVGADQGLVHALDPATGAERWHHRTGPPGERVHLTRAGTTVYAIGAGGTAHALDAATGRLRWRSRIPGAVTSRPLVAGGILYAGDSDGTTYALDTTTGTPLWHVRTARDEPTYTWSAAAGDGLLFTAGADRTLYALDPATGTSRWSLPLPKGRATGPVVAGDAVHVTARDGTLHTLDATTGAVRSRLPTGGTTTTTPVIGDGFVYVGSSNGNLYALPS